MAEGGCRVLVQVVVLLVGGNGQREGDGSNLMSMVNGMVVVSLSLQSECNDELTVKVDTCGCDFGVATALC